MSLVTLRILDGVDRGRVFGDLATPITIGREEGNSVQLNDERISRFHLKIQEDGGKIVLTDLESTNGTKANGESVKLWILRFGDVITVGRTVLLFGSREEIALRLASLRDADLSGGVELNIDELDEESPSVSLDFELNWSDDPDAQTTLHTLMPPDIPEGLAPGQAAQISELLQYIHMRVRGLLQSVKVSKKTDRVSVLQRQWQNLLDIDSQLATYIRSIGDPD